MSLLQSGCRYRRCRNERIRRLHIRGVLRLGSDADRGGTVNGGIKMLMASFARGVLMDRGWGALGFCAKPQVYTYVTDSAPLEGRRKQGRIYAHLNESNGTVAFEVAGKNVFQKHEVAHILSKCAEFYNVVKDYGWRLE